MDAEGVYGRRAGTMHCVVSYAGRRWRARQPRGPRGAGTDDDVDRSMAEQVVDRMQVAVVVTRHGGPEVLELQQRPVPDTPEDGVLVQQHCAGVNFIDTCAIRCCGCIHTVQ